MKRREAKKKKTKRSKSGSRALDDDRCSITDNICQGWSKNYESDNHDDQM